MRTPSIEAPRISVGTCSTCSVPKDGDCALAKLQIKLQRVPTTTDTKAARIDVSGIPALFCPNGYTNSSNDRIF